MFRDLEKGRFEDDLEDFLLKMKLSPFLLVAVDAREYRYCSEEKKTIDLSQGLSFDIASPDFPAAFSFQTQCKWDVQAPQGTRIRMSFPQFFVPPNTAGTCDYMFVTILEKDADAIDKFGNLGNGLTTGANHAFCGTNPAPIVSKGNSITIILQSDTNNNDPNNLRSFTIQLSKTLAAASPTTIKGVQMAGKSLLMLTEPQTSASFPSSFPAPPGRSFNAGPAPSGRARIAAGNSYPKSNPNRPLVIPSHFIPGSAPGGFSKAPTGFREAPTGFAPAPVKPKRFGIPTRLDGRVDTNLMQRMMNHINEKRRLGLVTTPDPNAPRTAMPTRKTPSVFLKMAPRPQEYPTNPQPVPPVQLYPIQQYPGHLPVQPGLQNSQNMVQYQEKPPSVVENRVEVIEQSEISTLALIAIALGLLSIISGITLMLFMRKRRDDAKTAETFEKYVRDHTPVSRHSSIAQESPKLVEPPKDFMDKKEVDLIRTLSRAPMGNSGEDFYQVKSKSSNDSGFLSRKVSYLTTLKN